MTLQEEYRVSLDAFQGPMDLLLYLIRRAEVDVQDIRIAEITDQYLAFLRGIDAIDIDVAGEFLVTAATLIEIKSRSLVPVDRTSSSEDGADGESGDGESLDPRFELIQVLLAYQRYRVAAETLNGQRLEHARRFALRPTRRRRERDADVPLFELEDLHVLDLQESYERIAASIDFTRLGDHHVEIDDTPIALHQEDLLDRLERSPEKRLTLQESFEGRTVGQRVGLFLAMLELTRLRRIRVSQEHVRSDIIVEMAEDEPTGAVAVPTAIAVPPTPEA
ncbi:MAG: segregation/condensation protein A [Phycisphaerales bacterium]|nr:segregation/condensation protein A [Phycisphaerales bacterium]